MEYDISQWSKKQKWLVLFVIYILVGLWQTGIFVYDNLASHEPARFAMTLVQEITGALTGFLLLPLLIYFFKSVPLQQGKILKRLPSYFLVWIVYGIVLTYMLYYSRTIVFIMFDLGQFQYGLMIPRIIMETIKQFFVFWVIYFIRLYVVNLQETQIERLRAEKFQKELTRSRLQTLQMQLNPHFLFNTLNVISSTMYDNIKAADTMIADLSDLLRQTLNSMNWEAHPLRNELSLLDLYIKIMKERFQEKLTINLDIADDAMDALVPGFILQPFVENSIRYSMEESAEAVISITAKKERDTLRISITDNGPGVPPNFDPTATQGVGISNALERLKTLYDKDQHLQFENNDNGGVSVMIALPYHVRTKNNGVEYENSHRR